MTRPPLLGLTAAFMLFALAAAVSCGDAEDEPAQESTAPTQESATATPETPKPTITVPLSLPEELPRPSEGYRWWEIQAAEQFGFPGYAVQAPLDWVASGPGNPSSYESANATEAGPRLFAYVMPVGTVYSHPLLNLLPMQGTTCRDGIPRLETPSLEQITGNYTWDVYTFGCSTRVSAAGYERGERPIPYDVRGAEVRVGDYVFTVATFEPVASGAARIAFEQAVRSFRHRAATVLLPKADLPAAADGYTWFETPSNSFWTALFVVQVPLSWKQDNGSFSPVDYEAGSPYTRVPDLSFEASVSGADLHPWWHHPIRDYTGQEGVSCTGDLSGDDIVPSGEVTSGAYNWDTYRFSCRHEEPCCPPGVAYDVRAAEARVGNVIVSIVALEAVGSGDTGSAFTQALRTLTVR